MYHILMELNMPNNASDGTSTNRDSSQDPTNILCGTKPSRCLSPNKLFFDDGSAKHNDKSFSGNYYDLNEKIADNGNHVFPKRTKQNETMKANSGLIEIPFPFNINLQIDRLQPFNNFTSEQPDKGIQSRKTKIEFDEMRSNCEKFKNADENEQVIQASDSHHTNMCNSQQMMYETLITTDNQNGKFGDVFWPSNQHHNDQYLSNYLNQLYADRVHQSVDNIVVYYSDNDMYSANFSLRRDDYNNDDYPLPQPDQINTANNHMENNIQLDQLDEIDQFDFNLDNDIQSILLDLDVQSDHSSSTVEPDAQSGQRNYYCYEPDDYGDDESASHTSLEDLMMEDIVDHPTVQVSYNGLAEN